MFNSSPPVGRRALRPRGADASRDALRGAATALFAAHGFDGVSVERIAREAGVNKAMISYYFGGKRGLYRSIILSTFADLVARLEALTSASAPVESQLREFVRTFSELAVARQPSFPAMLLREVLGGGRLLDEGILARLLAVFATLREIVERGVREGVFRPVDPVLTHISVIGSLAFFFATAPFRERLAGEGRLPGGPPAAEDYVRHIQDLLIQGLAAGSREA